MCSQWHFPVDLSDELSNPFSLSHLQDCCWGEGQFFLIGQRDTRDRNWQTRKVFFGFFIMSWIYCAVAMTSKWVVTCVRNMLLSMPITESTTTKNMIKSILFQELELVVNKVKTECKFLSFTKFHWGKKLWPRKWNIHTPVKALSLGDITVSGVSNHVLWKARSVLVSF